MFRAKNILLKLGFTIAQAFTLNQFWPFNFRILRHKKTKKEEKFVKNSFILFNGFRAFFENFPLDVQICYQSSRSNNLQKWAKYEKKIYKFVKNPFLQSSICFSYWTDFLSFSSKCCRVDRSRYVIEHWVPKIFQFMP